MNGKTIALALAASLLGSSAVSPLAQDTGADVEVDAGVDAEAGDMDAGADMEAAMTGMDRTLDDLRAAVTASSSDDLDLSAVTDEAMITIVPISSLSDGGMGESDSASAKTEAEATVDSEGSEEMTGTEEAAEGAEAVVEDQDAADMAPPETSAADEPAGAGDSADLAQGNDLDSILDSGAETRTGLQTAMEGNMAITAKLETQGYEASDVVAVDVEADGSATVYVDDRS